MNIKMTLSAKITALVLGLTLLGVACVIGLSFLHTNALLHGIGSMADQQALERILETSRMRMVLFALPTALVFGVITLFAVRTIIKPLQELTQVAQRLGTGEKGIDLPLAGPDEIGVLTHAIQTMQERLHHADAKLQHADAKLHHADAKLREMTITQDEQVQRRTSELAEARDQALAASKAKSEFMATMSHEIRTPMNVVMGMLELLRDAPMSHERMEQIRLAYSSGKTLMALIDNVLDFSKIEADHFMLDEMDFDLRSLVDESALILATLAHTKEIELTPFFPHGMPTAVRGDVNRLRQIFTNLVGNAIKFTPEGGSVELHGGPISGDDQDQTEYLFEVRDTGPGVLPEDREKIFDRFFQAERLRTHGYPGTGLGLAISKHLVEQMGGEIGIDANPYAPSGSIFHFTVKLTRQAMASVADAERGVFKHLRVLCVEIDGLQRLFLEDVFTLFGARFAFVFELDTAVDMMRQAKHNGEPFDLVILNQKPGRDSRSVCRNLRNLELGSRFILLTDLLDQGWDQAVDLPGIAMCLKKPVSAERLRSAIDWILQAHAGESQHTAITSAHKETVHPLRYHAWILLVDDHAANLTVARGMLARLGCDPAQVVTAVDGREGVARFMEKPFQLVFMDCQMPGMDGYEASRMIRQWEKEHQKPPVPIVAFTANVTSGNRQQGELAGMDDFLAKPVTLNELRSVLERFLTPFDRVQPEMLEEVPQPQPSDLPNDLQTDLTLLLGAMASIGLPEEDFKDVAHLLASQIPELLQNLERNLLEGDYEAAKATAHVLKGSMANTIFPQLQTPTRLLHDKIRNKSWPEAQQFLHEVLARFAPVQKALDTFLNQGCNV